MATPSHDELRGLLAAYALGSVEDDEARVVSAHLAECAECRRELRRLQDTVLRLTSEEAPSPTVWQRILRRIRQSTDE
jgi:anti-sigma factor RsiW